MERKLGRFIDSLRSTPSVVVRTRVIEATNHLETEGVTMADAFQIYLTIQMLHPTTAKGWRDGIRLKRVEETLPRLVESGIYSKAQMPNDEHGQKVVYSRIKPQTYAQQ